MSAAEDSRPCRLTIEGDSLELRRSYSDIISSFSKHEQLICSLLPIHATGAPESLVAVEYIMSLFKSSLQLFSESAVIQSALTDSREFVLPDSLANTVNDILSQGSVSAVAQALQVKHMHREINLERFNDCARILPPTGANDPLLEVARTLASTGSTYCKQHDYLQHLYHKFEDMRPRIRQMGNCALKHAAALCLDGKGLLLDVRQMPDGPEAFCKRFGIDTKAKAHHTAKYNSDGTLRPAGRFLQDLNEDPEGLGYFLHAEENKQLSRDRYGDYIQEQMVRPSLQHMGKVSSFLQRIYDLCVTTGWRLQDLRGIVEDNKGAFNAIRVDPTDVALVSMRVSTHFLFIPTSNGFGITSTPSIWDTVNKFIDYNIRATIFGILFRWTDDRAIVTHFSHVSHDKAVLHRENVRMFGPDPYPLDLEKSQEGAVIVCVGYCLKFLPGTISPNDKGVRKLLVVFFVADISSGSAWSLKFCQKVSSLADRYSQVILGMRGFSSVFYSMLRLPDNATRKDKEFGVRYPNSEHRFSVLLWRSVVITLLTRPGLLDVPIFSLVNRHAETEHYYYVASDAYNKLGLTVHSKEELLAVSSFPLPFDAPEADYQNVKEFLGLLLGLVILKCYIKAPRGTRIHFTSDSKASLSWITKNRAKSLFAQRSFTAYTWLCVYAGFDMADAVHESATTVRMKELDDLSRLDVVHNYPPHKLVDLSQNAPVVELFRLCDPTMLLGPSVYPCDAHLTVFTQITDCLRRLCTE